MKKVKRVELIKREDFDPKSNPIAQIMRKFKECDFEKGKASSPGDSMIFTYYKGNELVDQQFTKIKVGDEHFFADCFEERHSLAVVRIWYEDGTCESGFKWYDNTDIVCKRNGVLKGIYLKDGTYTGMIPDYGEIKECYDVESSSRIPAWLMEMFPLYNERIRDLVEADSLEVEKYGHTLREWACLNSIMQSGYVNSDVQFTWVKKPDGGVMGLNWAITDIRVADYRPSLTTWDDNVCVTETCSTNQAMEMVYKPVVSVYSYLKSIYEDKTVSRNVYHLIPLSELLTVKKRNWRRDVDEDGAYEVLWTNLDATVDGDIDLKVA